MACFILIEINYVHNSAYTLCNNFNGKKICNFIEVNNKTIDFRLHFLNFQHANCLTESSIEWKGNHGTIIEEFFSFNGTIQIDEDCFIGRNSTIGMLVVIKKRVKIQAFAQISHNVFIHDDVVIGRNVTISQSVSIKERSEIGDNVILRNIVHIDTNAFIGANSTLTDTVYIDKNAYVGSNARISNYTNILERANIANNVQLTRCNVGAEATIGKNSIIERHVSLPNASRIGESVYIGEAASILGTVYDNSVIDQHSIIGIGALVGNSVYVGTHVIIPDQVMIARNTIIHRNVVMPFDFMIGVENVIIKSPSTLDLVNSINRSSLNLCSM